MRTGKGTVTHGIAHLPALTVGMLVLVMFGCRTSSRGAAAFRAREVVLEGTTYKYQIFVPPGYDASKRWPVILFLHGAGERGSDGEVQTQVGLGAALRRAPESVPAIVVFPQVPKDSTWSGAIARMAMAALDQTMRELRTDPKRVYLTGISMGGYGTWQLAFQHPDRFAALAPVCGGVRFPRAESRLRVTAVPENTADPYTFVARGVRHIPTWIFHGGADPVVPVMESRQMVEALRALGAPVKYTEYPGVGHNSWDPAYAEPELWTWMLEKTREPGHGNRDTVGGDEASG